MWDVTSGSKRKEIAPRTLQRQLNIKISFFLTDISSYISFRSYTAYNYYGTITINYNSILYYIVYNIYYYYSIHLGSCTIGQPLSKLSLYSLVREDHYRSGRLALSLHMQKDLCLNLDIIEISLSQRSSLCDSCFLYFPTPTLFFTSVNIVQHKILQILQFNMHTSTEIVHIVNILCFTKMISLKFWL